MIGSLVLHTARVPLEECLTPTFLTVKSMLSLDKVSSALNPVKSIKMPEHERHVKVHMRNLRLLGVLELRLQRCYTRGFEF